jgi:hypothetical protein
MIDRSVAITLGDRAMIIIPGSWYPIHPHLLLLEIGNKMVNSGKGTISGFEIDQCLGLILRLGAVSTG